MILWSLGSALGYGLSDFVGGKAARTRDPRMVALVSQLFATSIAYALLLTPLGLGSSTAADIGWGCGAGVGAAAGNILIYRGIARHSAINVAPASGIAAVAVPVVADITGGTLPSGLQTTALVLALPAIWLVAGGSECVPRRGPLMLGFGAGAGFGAQFTCLAQPSPATGLGPLIAAQSTSVLVLAVVVACAGRHTRRTASPGIGLAALAGSLAGAATISFQIAVRLGSLGVGATLASMYPAVTVLAAAAFDRQSLTRRATVGLGLCVLVLGLLAL